MWSKFKTWFAGLSSIGKVVFASLLAATVGTLAVAGANPSTDPGAADKPTTSQQVAAEATVGPKIEKKTHTETIEIPFETVTENDSSLEKGKTHVKTVGAKGIKTITYEQTYTDGVPGDKVVLSEEVTTPPVTQVTSVGTKVKTASSCDSNYSGACVPIASDVDCAGGSGNGPAYVSGPVYVVGSDIYDLDRDGNGVGCE